MRGMSAKDPRLEGSPGTGDPSLDRLNAAQETHVYGGSQSAFVAEREALIAEKNNPAEEWAAAKKTADEFIQRELARLDEYFNGKKAELIAEKDRWLGEVSKRLGWRK
jgi:hypothetical protein